MIPILFEYNETDFTTHGLGDLVDCIECKARATDEGEYEMSFNYPANGELFSELQIGRIVLAKVNDYHKPQRFRIYGIESGINQTVTVNCQHISYDLASYPVKIFKDQLSPARAIAAMKNNIVSINSGTAETFPFTISGYQIQGFSSQRSYTRGDYVIQGGYTWQAIENIAAGNDFDSEQWTVLEKFKVESPKSIREILLDGDDSVLGLYGGDAVFDNMSVSIEKTAGQDRGVTIEYGVDLVDFTQDKNITEMVTGVLPYWKGSIRGSGSGSLGNNYEVYTGDRFEEGYTYYTRNPIYAPTSDVSYDAGKTYYIQSGNTYTGITLDDLEFKLDFDPSKTYFENINGTYTPTSDAHYQWNKEYYIQASEFVYSSITANDLIIQSGVTYYERAGYSYVLSNDVSPQPGETYYILENGTYREIVVSDLDFDPDKEYYERPSTDPTPEPEPDPDPNKSIYVVANYDGNKLVGVSVYDKNANLIHQRTYTRDANTGDYTGVTIDTDKLSYTSTLDEQGIIVSRTGRYKFGKLVIQEQYNNGVLYAVYIYNDDHDVIHESYENGTPNYVDVRNPDSIPIPDPDIDPELDKTIYVVAKYDNENNLTGISIYDENITLVHRRTYTRDANTGDYTNVVNDLNTLRRIGTYDSSGTIKYERFYDETGNLIIQYEYTNGILQAVFIDNEDHEVVFESYENGEINNVIVTNPDADPNPEPEPEPEPDPNVEIYVVVERNSENKILSISVYAGDDNLVYRRRYDTDGSPSVDVNTLTLTEDYENGVIKGRSGRDASGHFILSEHYTDGELQDLSIYDETNNSLVYEDYFTGVCRINLKSDTDKIHYIITTDPEPNPNPNPDPDPDPDPDPELDPDKDISVVLKYDEENNLFNVSMYDGNATLIHRRTYVKDTNTGYIDVTIDTDELKHEVYWGNGGVKETGMLRDASGREVGREIYSDNKLKTVAIYNQDHKRVVFETYDLDAGKILSITTYNQNADSIIYPNSSNTENGEVQSASIKTFSKTNDNMLRAASVLLSTDNESIDDDNDSPIPNEYGYVLTSDEHYVWDKTYYIEKQVNIIDDETGEGVITYDYTVVSAYDLIFKSDTTVYKRSATGYERTSDTSYQRGKNYFIATPNLGSFIPVDFENLAFRHGTTYWEETGFNYTVATSKQPGVVYYVSEEISDKEEIVYGRIQYADGFSTLPSGAQKIEPLDLSEFFEAETESQIPTAARLEKKARQYILANDIGIPAIDLTVQYASLQQDVRLFDAVTVKFPKLGISTTAKVSSYSYDVLREICTEIEVKNAKASSSWSTLEDASRLRKGIIAPSRIGKKSITGDRISSGTIDGSNIASGGIGSSNLASKSVTSTKIADNSITYNKIVDGAVIASKISDGAVRGQHILDQAIGLKKLDKDLQVFYSDIIAAMHIFSDRATINRYVEAAGYYGTVYLVNVDGHYYSMSGHTHYFQADVNGNVHILPEVDWTGGDHFFNMRQTAFFKKEIAAAEERGAETADAKYEQVTAYAGGDYTSITRQGNACSEKLYYYDYDAAAFRRYTTRLYFAGTQFWYRPAGNGGVYYRKK